MKVLVNGEIRDRSAVQVDLEDRGFQFGDGIYEVIRIYNGSFFTFTEHLARLERSARELKIKLPISVDLLAEKAMQLVEIEGIEEGILYIQVTRGAAPRVHHFPEQIEANLYAYAKVYPRPLTTIKEGVTAILVEDIRWLRCDIKSTNLLGNVLAKQAAKEAGAFEAIQHRGNLVTEGSSSNVLIVKNNKIFTHPANNLILNGITRQVLFTLAKEAGIPVIEESFSVEELLNADEVMITSTTSEITPIIAVQGKKIGAGTPGPVTRRLQAAFEEKINLNR